MGEIQPTGRPKIDDEKLKADLERYRQMALALGADDARIVPIQDITQRIRARYGDVFPRRFAQGTSYYVNIVDQIPWKYAKAIKESYRYCIVCHVPYPAEARNNFTGPSAGGSLVSGIELYRRYWSSEDTAYWEDVQKARQGSGSTKKRQGALGAEIVAEARKDGYHFAFCGASGGCTAMCRDAGFGEICVALQTGICRMPGKSLPCGTAAIMGLDHPGIYSKLGWKNWVQGWSIFPEDYPSGPINPPPARTTTIFIE